MQFTLPGGWLFTKAGDSLISDSDSQTETTKSFTLAMGETLANQNVGGLFPATVSGVILDEDTENGFASVVVSLMDGGTVLKTVSTNKNGEYQIEGVRPGTYRLRFELPNSSMFAIGTPLQLSQNEQEGESDSFTTGTSQNIAVQTLYAVLASQLEGNTWLDANADGNKDAGEAPITNVALTLIRESDGVIIGTTLPDEYGHYVFTGLRRGVYILEAELPERLLFADQNGKADGSGIPPTENNIGESLPIPIQSGETIPFNIGAIEQGSIGDTVWLDLNGNGLQDYKEPLISDVYISLLSISEDGDEEEISGSISDEYGYYHFRNLRPGQYRIRVESDVKLTQHLSELDEINSDPEPETYETAVFHLTSGEIKNNIDIGLAEEP
ncbi:MAG: carboxypeptidase regulatory-like domain-containing protein [Clostridia bacterium]|nr:carboxypeptidase regulatory-like domain-containing protein [Clostridia bacterium]